MTQLRGFYVTDAVVQCLKPFGCRKLHLFKWRSAEMRKKKGKQKSSERKSTSRMDEQNIQTVREWLARMERHLEKAIALSERIEPNGLDEETDLFWALVKYAENVQECVTQLEPLAKLREIWGLRLGA